MMAIRRASAIRAFRRLDRLAIANAQSFSFSGACSAPASRSLHRASSRGHRENGAVHVQGAVLALLAFEPLALPIEPRLLPSFFLSSSFSSQTKIMTAPPMAKNPPTTSSANLKAAQTLRSCRLPSIHPGNFERSIRCDDRNERAFENEDPRAYSCTAYPDFDSNGSATSREKAQDRCAALRLNFLFHWSSLRSKLESRFERGGTQ